MPTIVYRSSLNSPESGGVEISGVFFRRLKKKKKKKKAENYFQKSRKPKIKAEFRRKAEDWHPWIILQVPLQKENKLWKHELMRTFFMTNMWHFHHLRVMSNFSSQPLAPLLKQNKQLWKHKLIRTCFMTNMCPTVPPILWLLCRNKINCGNINWWELFDDKYVALSSSKGHVQFSLPTPGTIQEEQSNSKPHNPPCWTAGGQDSGCWSSFWFVSFLPA